VEVVSAGDDATPEAVAAALARRVREGRHAAVVGGMSRLARAALTRLAGLLDVMPVVDVVAIEAPDTFVRPMHAGNVLARVQSADDVKVLLVRAAAFEPVEAAEMAQMEIAPLELAESDMLGVEVLGDERHDGEHPPLDSARVVVGFGHGASGEQARKLVEELARKLNAAIGATRMVVDAGLAPNDWQVGQTGQTIAPKLYLAFGISGAQQHVAGIRDAEIVVAVNTDREAPIFRHADHGLVMDAEQALRELLEKL
jgi:electron transfer flavoprotein alpha subunit